jgi:hypothetical protein
MAFNQSNPNFDGIQNTANFNDNDSTAAATTGNFLPEIYSKKVLNFFRKASVAEAITNTDYSGEISAFGDTVKIIKEPTVEVVEYKRGGTITQQKLTDTGTTLTVDTANAFKFIVDDIETNMSHVNFKEMAASSAAYALKDAFDAGVLKTLSDASGLNAFTPHGGSGTIDHLIGVDADQAADVFGVDDGASGAGPIGIGQGASEEDPLDLLARMARLLDEQNVPEEGRWFVASPRFYEALSESGSKLLSVDFNAGQGSIRNGLVSSGKLRGFEMYKSNNMPAASAAGGSNSQVQIALAGHVSACATAQTIVNTEVIRDQASFGDICRGLHVYGADVLRNEALVRANYAIAA